VLAAWCESKGGLAQVDMNGKKNPWEGIGLIPFIDEEKLLVRGESVRAGAIQTVLIPFY